MMMYCRLKETKKVNRNFFVFNCLNIWMPKITKLKCINTVQRSLEGLEPFKPVSNHQPPFEHMWLSIINIVTFHTINFRPNIFSHTLPRSRLIECQDLKPLFVGLTNRTCPKFNRWNMCIKCVALRTYWKWVRSWNGSSNFAHAECPLKTGILAILGRHQLSIFNFRHKNIPPACQTVQHVHHEQSRHLLTIRMRHIAVMAQHAKEFSYPSSLEQHQQDDDDDDDPEQPSGGKQQPPPAHFVFGLFATAFSPSVYDAQFRRPSRPFHSRPPNHSPSSFWFGKRCLKQCEQNERYCFWPWIAHASSAIWFDLRIHRHGLSWPDWPHSPHSPHSAHSVHSAHWHLHFRLMQTPWKCMDDSIDRFLIFPVIWAFRSIYFYLGPILLHLFNWGESMSIAFLCSLFWVLIANQLSSRTDKHGKHLLSEKILPFRFNLDACYRLPISLLISNSEALFVSSEQSDLGRLFVQVAKSRDANNSGGARRSSCYHRLFTLAQRAGVNMFTFSILRYSTWRFGELSWAAAKAVGHYQALHCNSSGVGRELLNTHRWPLSNG